MPLWQRDEVQELPWKESSLVLCWPRRSRGHPRGMPTALCWMDVVTRPPSENGEAVERGYVRALRGFGFCFG